jgi:uncharacterized protein with GYD domain
VKTHVVLYKLTAKGIQEIKDAPQRIRESLKAAEAAGIKTLGFYATMGEYDYVAIGESPSEEAGVAFQLSVAKQGYVTTTTLRAFTPDEFEAIVKRIP